MPRCPTGHAAFFDGLVQTDAELAFNRHPYLEVSRTLPGSGGAGQAAAPEVPSDGRPEVRKVRTP